MAVERIDANLDALGGAAPAEERDLSLPPHSIQAEEAVLGSILKNPSSIVRVSDFLKPDDFYSQRNRHVFRAMLSLFVDGIPIDYHSTADRLDQQGTYDAAGGLIYLSELNLGTPSAAYIEHYGRIVERTSIMRQLIAKAQTIAEIAYRDNLDPDTALEKAEQLILSIAEKRVTRDFRSLEDVLADYMVQIQALQEGETTRYGIPTGYIDLDKLLGGFQRTDLIILAARTSVGKALALDTPIPTPAGWTTMGDLRVGDQVFDEHGRPCTVTFATPVQLERECFEVLFSDGERIVADADHQWSVLTRAARRSVRPELSVVTTREMAAALRTCTRHLNFSVPVTCALEYTSANLPIDPYVLGGWLGDGTSTSPTITVGDRELLDHLIAAGCEVRQRHARGTPQYTLGPWIGRGQRVPGNAKLTHATATEIRARLSAGATGVALASEYGVSRAAVSLVHTASTWRKPPCDGGMFELLRKLGLIGDKHIPRLYQLASVEQRQALLQGLMDTDGSITTAGYAEFCSTNRVLAEGVFELVVSLGLAPRLKEDRARLNGMDCGPRYRVTFLPTDISVFRLERKKARQRVVRPRARARQRFITAIRPVASVPVRCIQVDSPNHLYLAGRACIPTHNTSFALNLAVNAAIKHNATVAIFSLEMSAEQLASRLLSMESGVDSPRIRSAQLNEQEGRKLDAAMNHLARAPIWVDDTPSIPIMELRSKARRLAAEHNLDMIVVDYLQLVATEGGESRVQEIGQISRALKALARELRVPVLALSQLSRAVEQRTPHIPQLSDLRESGCLTGETRVALASGELVPIASLVGKTPEVVTLDGWGITTASASKVWRTGFKPVFKLKTRTGRVIRATGNHRFRKLSGWTALDQLRPGDRLAIPRRYPEPATPTMWDESRLMLLAHLIGDGCYASRQPIHYTSASEANLRAAVVASIIGCSPNTNVDTIPRDIWTLVKMRMKELGISQRAMTSARGTSHGGSSHFRFAPSRAVMGDYASILAADDLRAVAESDVFWDEVVSVEPDGAEHVYDMTVRGTHNFVANGIVVHNSLEQDADVVVFIYRDEKYNPDTDKKGVADIIVAKHRNGPTGQVQLLFLERTTKFLDLEVFRA